MIDKAKADGTSQRMDEPVFKRIEFEKWYAQHHNSYDPYDEIREYLIENRQEHGYSGKWFGTDIDNFWDLFCHAWNKGVEYGLTQRGKKDDST